MTRPRRTFAVLPVRKPETGRKAGASTATAPRTFAVPPRLPLLTEVLDHGGLDRQGFPGPPRYTCECGAVMRLEEWPVGEAWEQTIVTDPAHASDCLYMDWPRVVRLERGDFGWPEDQ